MIIMITAPTITSTISTATTICTYDDDDGGNNCNSNLNLNKNKNKIHSNGYYHHYCHLRHIFKNPMYEKNSLPGSY